MKKKLLLYFYLQCIFSISLFSQAPVNIIQNGDFEIRNGTTYPSVKCNSNDWLPDEYFTSNEIPGWNRYTGTPNVEPGFVRFTPAYSGARCIRIGNQRQYNLDGSLAREASESFYTAVNVRQGQSFQVSFYLKGVKYSSTGTVEVNLANGCQPFAFDYSACPKGPIPCTPTMPSSKMVVGNVANFGAPTYSNWTKVTFTICNVNANYSQLLFSILGNNTESTNEIFIDKVEAYVSSPLTLPNNLIVCPNQPFSLTASGANTYNWSWQQYYTSMPPNSYFYTGQTLSNSQVQTQTYTVTGIYANGCPSQTKSVNVIVASNTLAAPTVTQTQAPLFCVTYPNKYWYFHAESPGASSYNFRYIDHNGQNQYFTNTNDFFISAGSQVGYYPTVTVTANNGCTISPAVTVIGKVDYNNQCYPRREGLDDNSEISSVVNGNQIEISNYNQELMDVSVYSVKGNLELQKTSSEQNIIFDTKTLADGVYFIRIVNGNNIIKKKIVILH